MKKKRPAATKNAPAAFMSGVLIKGLCSASSVAFVVVASKVEETKEEERRVCCSSSSLYLVSVCSGFAPKIFLILSIIF